MPSLEDMPIEIREKIYALVPPAKTKIATYSRSVDSVGHSVEIALTVREQGKGKPSPDNHTALMLVSKQVSADAILILYQNHKFEFQTAKALELFLDQIEEKKEHLCHVAIATGGYEHESGSLYEPENRTFAMLASAIRLQTFTVSHFDFCCAQYCPHPALNIDLFARTFWHLLADLEAAREAKGLKVCLVSMLDMIKVDLPDCVGCFACAKSGMQSRNRSVSVKHKKKTQRRRCRCKCIEAEHKNELLAKKIKYRVAEYLDVEDFVQELKTP